MRVSNRAVIGWLIVLAVIAVSCVQPARAQVPTFTFGVSGTSSDGKTIVPTVTWATTPAASSCAATASPTKTDWTGTKTGAGASVLTAVSATTSFQLVCTWPGNVTAFVKWDKVTVNSDGTPITNLQGYRVQWGQSASDLAQTVYLEDATKTSWTSPALSPAGQWFFGVKAYNSAGIESDMSTVVSKTITAAQALTRSGQIVISKPSAPTNLTVE